MQFEMNEYGVGIIDSSQVTNVFCIWYSLTLYLLVMHGRLA